jgi:hypothetical protein
MQHNAPYRKRLPVHHIGHLQVPRQLLRLVPSVGSGFLSACLDVALKSAFEIPILIMPLVLRLSTVYG